MTEIIQYIIEVEVDANQVPVITPFKVNPPQRVSNRVVFIIDFLELLAIQFRSHSLKDINITKMPSSYILDDDIAN